MSLPTSPNRPILKRRDSDTRLLPEDNSRGGKQTAVSSTSLVDNLSGRPRAVQFSPSKDSVTHIIETHSAEVYDRSPYRPSPLSREELRGEHSPMRFLDPARRKVMQEEQMNRVRAIYPVEQARSPAATETRRSHPRNEVIVEEDEEDDLAIVPSRLNFAAATPQSMATIEQAGKPGNARYTTQVPAGHPNNFKTSRNGTSRDISQEMDDFFSPQESSDPHGS